MTAIKSCNRFALYDYTNINMDSHFPTKTDLLKIDSADWIKISNLIILNNLDIVRKIIDLHSKEIINNLSLIEDLFSIGILAFINALNLYNSKTKMSPEMYCKKYINITITKEILKEKQQFTISLEKLKEK